MSSVSGLTLASAKALIENNEKYLGIHDSQKNRLPLNQQVTGFDMEVHNLLGQIRNPKAVRIDGPNPLEDNSQFERHLLNSLVKNNQVNQELFKVFPNLSERGRLDLSSDESWYQNYKIIIELEKVFSFQTLTVRDFSLTNGLTLITDDQNTINYLDESTSTVYTELVLYNENMNFVGFLNRLLSLGIINFTVSGDSTFTLTFEKESIFPETYLWKRNYLNGTKIVGSVVTIHNPVWPQYSRNIKVDFEESESSSRSNDGFIINFDYKNPGGQWFYYKNYRGLKVIPFSSDRVKSIHLTLYDMDFKRYLTVEDFKNSCFLYYDFDYSP